MSMGNHKKSSTMTKLSYPKDGIYKYCKHYANSCANNLSNAMNNCNFDIPNGFAYKSYLHGLGGRIRELYNRTNNLEAKLQRSNNNIEVLSSDLLSSAEKMVDIKINERDRMIN